ncbi:GntR family transcriptional regulator [Ralstonia soli]|uniref:GntR family transcriptional regulator n=1 Tax=Ralstonia soli TaxID=2953896 RepID=A0ABT1ATF5_9RALS|nr:GntR family transcriptional regulator [Ralstonia soli]MCO5401740.1 GntR family transcriptional regulator [Ralstonia soli]
MSHLPTNQEIYERIYAAISERRLAPGTKLSEARLAQVFHASRTRIREVLMRLSQELVVELHANRGAFVARPTARDLRDVFAVRRALERAVATQLAQQYGGQSLVVMRSHLKSEQAARESNDRAALSRLTGDFHVRLAEITDNRLFSDNLRRLVALTGLVISQYDALASSACPEHEHADIVAAIESGDVRRAEKLMLDHLDHVEQGIRAPQEEVNETDFEAIFQVSVPVSPTKTGAGKRKNSGA